MDESKKTYRTLDISERQLLEKSVLDIGAGTDPVVPHAVIFDQAQGDANYISRYFDTNFDCVFSSHCLEHMISPESALKEWWQLVKPNGHLFFIVPDKELYEKGLITSRFNGDHKHTFTIAKKKSWSEVSVNVLDLVKTLNDAEVVSVKLNDIGCDRRYIKHGNYKTGWFARFLQRQIHSLAKRNIDLFPRGLKNWVYQRCLVDQTREKALAQIEVILKKVPSGS